MIIKNILKTIAIILGCGVAAVLLLAAVFCLPVNETIKTASMEIKEAEGWYPAIPIVNASLDTYFHSFLPGVLDGGSDGCMLESSFETHEDNVFKAAMDMNNYARYWHGYVVLLRPLFLLFDYGEIRVLNCIIQLLLLSLLFLQIYRKKGMRYGLLVLTSYFLLMPLTMPFSLQYSWVFYIAIGAALLLSRPNAVRLHGMKLGWFFMIVGICTGFFDLLTYPLYTWGFPLLWYLCLKEDNQKDGVYIKEVIYTGLWWILGYAGFWSLKWGFGSLILGRNVFEEALRETTGLTGTGIYQYDFGRRFEAIYLNWKHYEYKLYVFIFAIWLLYILLSAWRKGLINHAKNKAYLLIAGSGVLWYFVLTEHTSNHHFFTYRIYGVSILAVLFIMVSSIGKDRIMLQHDRMKKHLKLLAAFCLCGLLACVCGFLAREDIFIASYNNFSKEIPVTSKEVCTFDFVPTFSRIKSAGFFLETTSSAGNLCVQIWDGDKLLCEESVALEDCKDTNNVLIPVNWKLTGKKTYQMKLFLENEEGDTKLLISENMENTISEFGEVYINKKHGGGQIIAYLTYSHLPLSTNLIISLLLAWFSIWFSIIIMIGFKKDKPTSLP